MSTLSGRTAVVTGASSGIGRASARAGLKALLADVMPKADRPEVVADVVVKAATDARPRRRYTAGKAARQVSLLRRFAPAEMFDKTLRKQFRLPV